MGEAAGSNVGRGAARFGAGYQHGTFGDHARALFHDAPTGFALYAAAAGGQRIIAALPIDGIAFGRVEQREHPVSGLESRRSWGGGGRGRVEQRGIGSEFGHFRASPSAGAATAETGIGQEADGGLEALVPMIERGAGL